MSEGSIYIPEGNDSLNQDIANKINDTLRMDLNPSISLINTQLEITLDSNLELFFLINYLIDNVFGYNYRESSSSPKIIRTAKDDKKIIISNRTACQIFFNHINFNHDIDTLQDFKYQKFIYVKSNTNISIPVIIITDFANTGSSSYFGNVYETLTQYYKNAFSFDDDELIEKLLNVTGKSELNNLVDDLKSNIQKLGLDSVYIVYHLFSNVDRSNKWKDSDSYQEIYKIPGENKFGQYVMNYIHNGKKNIPRISTAERLKLKKNLDKMFDSQLSTN